MIQCMVTLNNLILVLYADLKLIANLGVIYIQEKNIQHSFSNKIGYILFKIKARSYKKIEMKTATYIKLENCVCVVINLM